MLRTVWVFARAQVETLRQYRAAMVTAEAGIMATRAWTRL
jgi:hypothetical protein